MWIQSTDKSTIIKMKKIQAKPINVGPIDSAFEILVNDVVMAHTKNHDATRILMSGIVNAININENDGNVYSLKDHI